MNGRATARLRCRACGYESANHRFFRAETNAKSNRTRRYCACCASSPGDFAGPAIGLVGFWSLLAIAAFSLPGGGSNFGYAWTFMAALVPASFLTGLVHELGHATTIRLAGAHVLQVIVGSGRPVWRWRLGQWRLDIHDLPWGGRTMYLPAQGMPKWKTACILLSGSIANAAGAGVLFAILAAASSLVSPLAESDARPALVVLTVIFAAAASQLLAAAVNLVPFGGRTPGSLPSDGKHLLALLRTPSHQHAVNDEVNRLLIQNMVLERAGRTDELRTNLDSGWRRFPENGHLFGALIHWTGRLDGPDAALEVYRRHAAELPSPETAEDPGWAYAFGNIAWHVVLAEDQDQLDLADRMSAAAMRLGPTPPVEATRGAVLACLGDPATGVPMITNALPRIDQVEDKAEFCDVLARIEAARGELAMAEDYIRVERRLRAAIA